MSASNKKLPSVQFKQPSPILFYKVSQPLEINRFRTELPEKLINNGTLMVNLSPTEHQTIRAILKILAQQNYKGRKKPNISKLPDGSTVKREDIVIKTTVHEFLQAYGLDTDNEGRITGKQRIETVKNALKRLKNRDVVIEWDSKIMYDSLIHAFVIDTKTKELEVQCHPIFDAFGRIEKRYILRSLSKDKIIKELAANRIRPHLTRLTDWLETLDIEIIKIRTTKLGKIAGLKYATSKDKGRLLKSLSNLLDLAKKGQWLLDWKLQKEENNFEIFLNPLLCRRLTHVSNFAEWLYEQQTSIEEKQKTIQITAEKISDICRKKLTKQAIRRLLRWMQQANQITWSENKQTYTITIFEKPAISITLSNL